MYTPKGGQVLYRTATRKRLVALRPVATDHKFVFVFTGPLFFHEYVWTMKLGYNSIQFQYFICPSWGNLRQAVYKQQ